MKKLLDFFIKTGKLKKMPRRGWVLRKIKNPETIAGHTFRTALMAWILGKKRKLNVERLLKMALIHDLCEVYAGDTTPYDSLLPKDEKELEEVLKRLPRFSKKKKKKLAEQKYQKEEEALRRLISELPPELKKEIKNLWTDYEKGLTPEGRFFNQADRLENLLQAMEYWKEQKRGPQKPWWEWARESFDDPILLEFVNEINKEYHQKEEQKG